MVEYRRWIRRQMLRDEPGKLFVFGDNMAREGYGGQAREMRGEPNAVGIPTKWAATRHESAYFKDGDFEAVAPAIDDAFRKLLRHDGDIVWPTDGIGTGLAQLPGRAPKIFKYIEKRKGKYPLVSRIRVV